MKYGVGIRLRRIQVNRISGKEILAKDIYSSSGVILISAGTILKREYAEKLLELGTTDVLIEDEISREIGIEDITEEKIGIQCTKQMKSMIERFSYASPTEMQQLVATTTQVMEDILTEEEVIYNISNVRDHSQSLYEHSLSVASLSVLTAVNAKYSKEKVREIAMGALLHDIGFLSVKEKFHDVILDEAEEQIQKEIKRHVVYGYIDVEQQDWLSKTSKEIILYHHERIDRSGYPFKMKGDRVSPEVKLVAICDAFDSMVYGNLQKRMKVYEAMEYIVSMGGIKFDLELSKVFSSSVAAYPTGSMVVTNIDKMGIVIQQNKQAPTRPIIHLLEEGENGEWVLGEEKNLMEELTLFIIDTV